MTAVEMARWPAALEPWLDAATRARALPPDWAPDCVGARAPEGGLRIVGISNGETIRRAGNGPAPELRLEARGGQEELIWLVNGRQIGRVAGWSRPAAALQRCRTLPDHGHGRRRSLRSCRSQRALEHGVLPAALPEFPGCSGALFQRSGVDRALGTGAWLRRQRRSEQPTLRRSCCRRDTDRGPWWAELLLRRCAHRTGWVRRGDHRSHWSIDRLERQCLQSSHGPDACRQSRRPVRRPRRRQRPARRALCQPGATPGDDAARKAAAQTTAQNISNAIGLLAQAGARHFLVSSLPDLGLTPEAATLGNEAASTDVTLQFNAALGGGHGRTRCPLPGPGGDRP
jgi:hypothetical protein